MGSGTFQRLLATPISYANRLVSAIYPDYPRVLGFFRPMAEQWIARHLKAGSQREEP